MTPPCPYCKGTGFKRPGIICICAMGKGKSDFPEIQEVTDLFDFLQGAVKEKTKSV